MIPAGPSQAREAAERPPAVGEQVEGVLAPDVGLGVPHRRDRQPQGPQQAPVLLEHQVLDPLVEAGRVAHLRA